MIFRIGLYNITINLYTKYAIESSYLEMETVKWVILVLGNPQMSRVEIHGVVKSPARISKIE